MIAVLVSMGRHPASGRAHRARADGQALELALRAGTAPVTALHAGSRSNEGVLRDYLGMGAHRLEILEIDQTSDVVASLADRLSSLAPRVVLCGHRSEQGEQSGLLPFMVARALGLPIVPRIAALRFDGDATLIDQALPGGRRQRLRVLSPVVGTVAPAAPEPRLAAFTRARRGLVEVLSPRSDMSTALPNWPTRPARARPVARDGAPVQTGGDRLAALLAQPGASTNRQRHVEGVPPEQAARVILDYLSGEGCLHHTRQPEDRA